MVILTKKKSVEQAVGMGIVCKINASVEEVITLHSITCDTIPSLPYLSHHTLDDALMTHPTTHLTIYLYHSLYDPFCKTLEYSPTLVCSTNINPCSLSIAFFFLSFFLTFFLSFE